MKLQRSCEAGWLPNAFVSHPFNLASECQAIVLELVLAKLTYRAHSRHDPELGESHQESCKPLLWLEGAVHVPVPGWRAAVLN